MSKTLPTLVCKLTHMHDAWIVGGAANPDNLDPRDYDVQVPLSKWREASQLIPKDAVPNAFGGWKCESDGKSIDVWPGELGWIMERPKCMYAWSPKSGTRLMKL